GRVCVCTAADRCPPAAGRECRGRRLSVASAAAARPDPAGGSTNVPCRRPAPAPGPDPAGRPGPAEGAGWYPATPCRPCPAPARWRQPGADSPAVFQALAGYELVAPGVVQIGKGQRLAAGQLQPGQAQGLIATGHQQALTAALENLP